MMCRPYLELQQPEGPFDVLDLTSVRPDFDKRVPLTIKRERRFAGRHSQLQTVGLGRGAYLKMLVVGRVSNVERRTTERAIDLNLEFDLFCRVCLINERDFSATLAPAYLFFGFSFNSIESRTK